MGLSTNDELVLEQLAERFFKKNYNYLWLRSMIEACAGVPAASTLITGSSYALSGIQERVWRSAINCSMHSQDFYYDYLCARRAILSAEKQHFNKCLIITGYYGAYHDLSCAKVSRESMIGTVYYPIFQDAHNWKFISHRDPWEMIGDIPNHLKPLCEQIAVQRMQKYGTYYSVRHRKPIFDLNGYTWAQISEEERINLGELRATDHNKLLQYSESYYENKKIFKEFIHFLQQNDVQPIVVIPPFTKEYNRFIQSELKIGTHDLLNSMQENISYVDLNESAGLFDSTDFVDTDHLNARGAEKFSNILAEKFGI